MGMAKIKKGDTVVILSGKDKGKTGEVTQSLPKDGKVVVAGVNIITRHKKPNQQDPQGGLERKEAPPHVSKVAEIGRASCRERGCQDVEIPVVAGALKKK